MKAVSARGRAVAAIAGLLIAMPLAAHDGVEHHSAEFDAVPDALAPSAELPHRLPDGSLFVPKPVQHLLALRTARVDDEPGTETYELAAEVSARADASTALSAPQSGRLEADASGWPLPGRKVQAGETLAWLQTLLTQRESARRSARVADLDQKIAIAQLNVDRIDLQSQANQGQVVAGNIYLEQAQADLAALRQQREQIARSLAERLPLKASVSGTLVAAVQRPGDAVAAGALLFEIAGAAQLRVTATTFDADLKPLWRSAQLLRADRAQPASLFLSGIEPLGERPGWRLLLDAEDAASLDGLSYGQPVRLELRLRAQAPVAAWPSACVRDALGDPAVWLHVAPEQFVRRPVAGCGGEAPLHAGERIVVAGGALLGQYP